MKNDEIHMQLHGNKLVFFNISEERRQQQAKRDSRKAKVKGKKAEKKQKRLEKKRSEKQ